jgi:sulfatase modifying factor 1
VITALLIGFLFAADAEVPCQTAPPGMACIPGGPAILGSDDGPANEHPKRKVEISTFYIDTHEVTQAQYEACVEAEFCEPLPRIIPTLQKAFRKAEQPAVSVDWFRADKYCRFVGKRLPTEWEWEKAARGEQGEIYPWGNAAPTCDKGHFRECAPKKGECVPMFGKKTQWDCAEHTTKPVGSYPAGHYGLFDMAGNGYEWTASWYDDDPSDATGRDPRGPCDGAEFCSEAKNKKKVLRGGSWYWPMAQVRGAYRRPERMVTGTHRLSVRCASDTPELAGFPTRLGTERRPEPPALPVPTAEQVALFTNVKEDVLVKPQCETAGRSFSTCRDPSSYLRSNETRRFLFHPYIENLGGGYAGVGIDQNYSFIASAKSEWVWLFDYDPMVTELHRLLRVMVLEAKDRQAFVALLSPAKAKDALALIARSFETPRDKQLHKFLYTRMRAKLHGYYIWQLGGFKKDKTFGWLATDTGYAYIRKLYQHNRIKLMHGDLLATNALSSIGAAAKALNVPIRIYYPSNAPECWPLSEQYKKNVMGLPADDNSVVLQTLAAQKSGFGTPSDHHWHYNVQSLKAQQALLARPGYTLLKQVVWSRLKTDDPDLTVSHLAAAQPSSARAAHP